MDCNELFNLMTISVPGSKGTVFSNAYNMTNFELCKQSFGYVGFILKYLHPDTSAYIKVFPLKGNGAKVLVVTGNHSGYDVNVYAVTHRNNIIKKLIESLNQSPSDLTDVLMEYNDKKGYADCFSDLAEVRLV